MFLYQTEGCVSILLLREYLSKLNNMIKLLRFNKESLTIPSEKLVCVNPHDNLIEVKYYDNDDNEVSELGYQLIHHWK